MLPSAPQGEAAVRHQLARQLVPSARQFVCRRAMGAGLSRQAPPTGGSRDTDHSTRACNAATPVVRDTTTHMPPARGRTRRRCSPMSAAHTRRDAPPGVHGDARGVTRPLRVSARNVASRRPAIRDQGSTASASPRNALLNRGLLRTKSRATSFQLIVVWLFGCWI